MSDVNLGRLVGDMADMLNRALGESVGQFAVK